MFVGDLATQVLERVQELGFKIPRGAPSEEFKPIGPPYEGEARATLVFESALSHDYYPLGYDNPILSGLCHNPEDCPLFKHRCESIDEKAPSLLRDPNPLDLFLEFTDKWIPRDRVFRLRAIRLLYGHKALENHGGVKREV